MKTSISQRYWFFLALLPVVFMMGMLGVEVSPVFMIPMIALLLIAGLGMMSLKCDHCGEPLLYREQRVLGVEMYRWGWQLPEKCPSCDRPV